MVYTQRLEPGMGLTLTTDATHPALGGIHHLVLIVGNTIGSGQVSVTPLAPGMVFGCDTSVAVRLELTTTAWGLRMLTAGHTCTLYVNSLWFDTTWSCHLNPLWKS